MTPLLARFVALANVAALTLALALGCAQGSGRSGAASASLAAKPHPSSVADVSTSAS